MIFSENSQWAESHGTRA